MAAAFTTDRRQFLKLSSIGIGGFLLGFTLPSRASAGSRIASAILDAAAADAMPVPLTAWVHVGADNIVTLFIHKAEMGQGTVTSLSMLLAEELECDWTKIRTEFPGVDRAYGSNQGVVGSQSIRSSYTTLRTAGATARVMLLNAAAAQWGVNASTLRVKNSVITNPATGKTMTYGAIAEAASKLPVPAAPALKEAKDFTIIGTSPKRLDTPSKVDGSAKFGIDFSMPGMFYAAVARCRVFGGKAVSFDDTQTKLVPGVRKVVQISTGIAVVADNTWSAMQGRDALDVKWDEGPNATATSDEFTKMFTALTTKPGAEAKRTGDAAAALATSTKTIDAIYETPYLSHTPMEPLNCTASVRADACDVWASTQGQSSARAIAARITGLPAEAVNVHTLYMGGGFGRRAGSDYVGEAVEISKAIGAPVKLQWSRQDDTRHDTYRPAALVRFSGGVDAQGMPVAWTARVACPSFRGAQVPMDPTAVEGLATLPYAFPNFLVEYHNPDARIPVSYWRSVGYSQNVFFAESFLDELIALGKQDQLKVRQKMLADQPRLLAALNLAAEKAGWGKPLPAGHALGLSVVNNIGSFTAQVAEVSVVDDTIKVHRVVCAVDCGQVVNPAGVAQQIQSGIIFGLSAALKGAITIDRGRVEQASFSDYDVIRIGEAPVMEVHVIPSTAAPGGIGEASTPGIAPAVANAVFAATGKRLRKLPMTLS